MNEPWMTDGLLLVSRGPGPEDSPPCVVPPDPPSAPRLSTLHRQVTAFEQLQAWADSTGGSVTLFRAGPLGQRCIELVTREARDRTVVGSEWSEVFAEAARVVRADPELLNDDDC